MKAMRQADMKLEKVFKVLSKLKGVRHSFYLTESMRAGLAKMESSYPSIGPLTIENNGVKECLKRKHVACIIKDKQFRAPPRATVYLIDETGKIVGRELLPGEKVSSTRIRKVVMLGNDFAVFFEKGTGKGAHFVLPSVPFKEIEELDGVKAVCSSSPSAAGDYFLRERAKLEEDPKLASILIGFELGGSFATRVVRPR